MNIAELSILGSFICFLILFFKKAYPFVISGIDGYINEVKSKVTEAEKLKEEAEIALKDAEAQKKRIEQELAEYKVKSEQRLALLESENNNYLKLLEERSKNALDKQLKMEFSRQKQQLFERLSDLVIKKITEKIKNEPVKNSVNFSEQDLNKLL